MKKMKQRWLALGLAASMLLMAVGCGEGSQDDEKENPDSVENEGEDENENADDGNAEAENELAWLNTEGGLPLVEEGTDITLTIAVRDVGDGTKPEETWAFKYIEEVMNINLEVITYTEDSRNDFVSLMFAGGELPDLYISDTSSCNFTTEELVTFGQYEGQIIDLKPYMNENYMPNLVAYYEENPEQYSILETPEGAVYSLGSVGELGGGSICRSYWNLDWFEQCNLELPTTLDGFMDAMRTFKAEGLCEYPISGAYDYKSPYRIFLNALGYVAPVYEVDKIMLREGEVVLPMADREVFGEFLKVMNQCYTEGLIHPDFFTMDKNTVKSYLALDAGVMTEAPFLYTDNFNSYWGGVPLTSEWNDTAQWTYQSDLGIGNVVVTSACEYPELAAKFIDYFYTPDYEEGFALFRMGPNESETDLLYDGISGWSLNENNEVVYADVESGAYQSNDDYVMNKISFWGTAIWGLDAWYEDPESPYFLTVEDWMSYEDPAALRKEHEVISTNGSMCHSTAMLTAYTDYITTDIFPTTIYMDPDTTVELNDTLVALEAYASQEIAKFITGARALTDEELDDYFTTLEGLGALDYVQAYADYYASVQ